MVKFKVGDIIKGDSEANHRYAYTNGDMLKGEVTYVGDSGTFTVKVLEHKNKRQEGESFSGLEHKYFKYYDDSKGSYKIEGVSVSEEGEAILLNVNDKIAIAIPKESGVGLSSVKDGEIFVPEIGEALAFYRHQVGGVVR